MKKLLLLPFCLGFLAIASHAQNRDDAPPPPPPPPAMEILEPPPPPPPPPPRVQKSSVKKLKKTKQKVAMTKFTPPKIVKNEEVKKQD